MLAIDSELRRRGHDSVLINVTDSRGELPGPKVINPGSALDLAFNLVRGGFDVVHYHIGGDFSARLVGLTLLCGSLPRTQSVVTFHSGGFTESVQQTAKRFSVRGAAFRSQDAVIGVNEHMIRMFRAYGVPAGRTNLILPFDLQLPDPNVVLPESLSTFAEKADPLLISVGGLEPEYRNGLLIEAMPFMLRKFQNAKMMIVGSGTLAANLRDRIDSLNLQDRILLTGNLEREVTLKVIEKADVLFRITDYDGDSIAVREALFLGTPVVASDNVLRPKGCILAPANIHASDLLGTVEKALEPQFRGQWRSDECKSNSAAVVDLYERILKR